MKEKDLKDLLDQFIKQPFDFVQEPKLYALRKINVKHVEEELFVWGEIDHVDGLDANLRMLVFRLINNAIEFKPKEQDKPVVENFKS